MRLNTRASLVAALAAAVAWSVPGLAAPAPAAHHAPRSYTIEQFMSTTAVTGASFSADESRILFSSNATGVYNVYSVPVAGGPPAPMTSSKDTTTAVSYFRGDDRILFTRDQSGNELNHLYVREKDGTERDLTPGAKLKAAFQGWTPAGDAFYVATNERDPKFFDLYRHDAKTYNRTLVFKDEVGYQLGAISPDGRWLAFHKPRTQSEGDLFLWDGRKSEMKRLSAEGVPADFSPEDFDADSTHLYYLSNEGAEFARVRRYDLAAGTHEDVERADWDVMYTRFSRRGRYRVTGINEDAHTVVKVYDTRTGKPLVLPSLPAGDITSVVISPSEARMAFYASGDRSPSNLYVHTFGEKEARRLTDSLSKEIDAADLVEASVVRFKSFDAMVIPNILFRPHQATPESKAPALVWVHGGPGGQTRKGYSALIQYLVNHGYVVLGINNRGSSGYGRTFFTADDLKHGHEPLWDCVEAKKYLASLPYVDKDRIGIIGGSYGGYMVLAALTLKPEEFAVGVDMFGISNWVRTLESIPPWWESQRLALYKEIGDPVKDKEMLLAVSPLFHADQVKRPLMVLQGANDPRVIKVESDDIVAAVKRSGVPVDYVVFPDEGHGFTKRENQIRGYRGILQFLDAHLKGAGTPAS
ncbi:MAG TPA: prolyl oligopeptidase family serine peptidase [Vicinamibacteria bacterium]|nr:prolyl oligopeptidase family serine peptidase [Vicinamibacteria bacterium]